MEPAASPEWLVVVGPDGVVTATTGGAPSAWIGRALADQGDATPALRAAATAVVARVRDPARATSVERVRVAAPAPGEPAVDVIALEAIVMHRTPTPLRALLESALAILKVQADGIEAALQIDCPAELPSALAVDPEKLAWAVATLVGNALRHVRRGTRSRPGGAVVVRVVFDPARYEVAIVVEDDGPGIPAAQQPWLFVRKPGATHAAGLALALVHDVVRAHGGDVTVASRTAPPDTGTTITLRLPAR